MATKNDKLLLSRKHDYLNVFKDNGSQYSNLNLSQTFSNESSFVQSKNKSNNNNNRFDDIVIDSCYQEKEKPWSKTTKNSTTLKPFDLHDESMKEEKEEAPKRWMYDSLQNSSNSSTLSLHIAAYENNFIDASSNIVSREEAVLVVKKMKNAATKPSLIKTSFEFPRQQDNNEAMNPEVMQFKASQKLLNPNRHSSSVDSQLQSGITMGEPPVITTSTKFDRCRGAIFGVSMLLSAFLGCIYVLMPLAPLIFIHPRIYRRLVDRLVGFWLVMPSALMEYLFDVKLTITGDEIDHSRPAVIIMNHRTRLDWLYFWSVLFRINPWLLTSEKISLKGILKYVPGAGWAMGSNCYMFLERSFENDSKRIDHLIEYYANVGDNYQLLLFPEGTDKCPRATGRSKTYAEKKGITHYDYVLHPRVTGFVHIIQKMRKENYIDHLYDVTIAFNDSIVQSEVDLIKLGVTAKDVRFDIRKISITDLPTSDQELGEWLRNLWIEKEERLRKFYSQSADTRQLDKLSNAKSFDLTPQNRIFQLLILFMWIILTIGWIYFFSTSDYRFWFALATIGFYVGLQKAYHGSEMFISKIGLDEWRKRSRHGNDQREGGAAHPTLSNGNMKHD